MEPDHLDENLVVEIARRLAAKQITRSEALVAIELAAERGRETSEHLG